MKYQHLENNHFEITIMRWIWFAIGSERNILDTFNLTTLPTKKKNFMSQASMTANN